MSSKIRFTASRPGGDRIHYLTEADVRVVLSRLPTDVCCPLRAVHFNDRSRGANILGYVNRGRREISICALPPRVSLTRGCLLYGELPEHFGAVRGKQWDTVAVRRFLLYDVFLHELGHLQLIDPHAARSDRLRFAGETLAQEFAVHWRTNLWSSRFDHPDPVHNPPGSEESAAPNLAASIV